MFSYRKIGGIHFVKVGRFGFQWYVSRRKPRPVNPARECMFVDHLIVAR